jgi:recombinational DNA repair protein (RecF pathway)
MPTYSVRALTIRRWRRRDADRVYRVLTEERGILDVTVAGAARITSKLASHLEPYAEARLLLARGRGPFRVAGAMQVQRFVGGDELTVRRLAQVAAVAEQLVPVDQALPGAFAIVRRAWEQVLTVTADKQTAVVAQLAYDLCESAGYGVPTKTPVPPEPRRFLQFMDRYLASVLPRSVRLG